MSLTDDDSLRRDADKKVEQNTDIMVSVIRLIQRDLSAQPSFSITGFDELVSFGLVIILSVEVNLTNSKHKVPLHNFINTHIKKGIYKFT